MTIKLCEEWLQKAEEDYRAALVLQNISQFLPKWGQGAWDKGGGRQRTEV